MTGNKPCGLRFFVGKAAALAFFLGVGLAAPPAFSQGRAGSETEEEALLKRAEEAFQNADYDNAADLYDQAIALDPTRVEAFVKRASLYFRQKKYTEAIELLTRAEKLSVSDLSVKTALGLTLYESGQRDRGLSYLHEVAKQRPETFGAQFQLGKHYARTEPKRAIEALDQYFRYRPEDDKRNDWEAQYLLGTAHHLRENHAESARFLELAQKARPKDHQIQLMLGAVRLSLGQWERAAHELEPYASEVQKRPSVAFNLASCYLHLGRRDEAKKLAQTYRGLKPGDPRGAILLGQIEQAGGKETDYREALARYQEAQELLKKGGEPSKVHISEAIGQIHLLQGDTRAAAALTENALAEQSGKADEAAQIRLLALGLEARLQQMNANKTAPGTGPAGLMPMAEKLAQLASQDAKVLALAGSGAYASGNFEKARRWFSESLQADDALKRARVGLSRTHEQLALLQLSNVSETEPKDAAKQAERQTALSNAVSMLRQAQKQDDSPSVIRNLATVLVLSGNTPEAEKLLQNVAGQPGPKDGLSAVLKARILGLQKQPVQAVEVVERALVDARKHLDNLPTAEGGRRPQLVRELTLLRLEFSARVFALDVSRTGPTTAKDRERLDAAIEAAQQASRDVQAGPDSKELHKTAQRNLQLLKLRRGRQRLADVEVHIAKVGVTTQTTKEAEEALLDLQHAMDHGPFESKAELGYAQCLAGLASAQANQFKTARDLIAKAKDSGCELSPPFNKLGTELLAVFVQYRASTSPIQREALLRTLPRLQNKAVGTDSATVLKVLRALLYSTNLALAYDYHLLGRSKLLGPTLRNAQKVAAQRSDDEDPVLTHNLAVADLLEGKPGGEKVLERLAPNPPEALLNLGVLSDRRGEAKKALDFYRRAAEKGARSSKLREWIDAKDRVFGSGHTP